MKFVLKVYEDIRQQVEMLSVKQLLKAIACPQASADDLGFEKDYAGVYIHPATKTQINAFVENCNDGMSPTTLICSDTECGAGNMIVGCTKFSTMMGLGIVGDPEIAYKVGRVAAKECIDAGYRWSLSPCVDILIEDESPMASTRCAGENADTVIKIAGAYMRGLQDGGVAATIKHFPGDGATVYDQHLTTLMNNQLSPIYL